MTKIQNITFLLARQNTFLLPLIPWIEQGGCILLVTLLYDLNDSLTMGGEWVQISPTLCLPMTIPLLLPPDSVSFYSYGVSTTYLPTNLPTYLTTYIPTKQPTYRNIRISNIGYGSYGFRIKLLDPNEGWFTLVVWPEKKINLLKPVLASHTFSTS